MLKRHQCSIDLKNNVLIIGTTGTQTAFLTESELPECARLTGSAEEEQKAIEESKKIQEELEISEALQKSQQGESSGGASTSQQQQARDNFSEADILELTKHGFDRQSVIDELRKFKGDKKQALAALFAKSLKF
jgi:DNA damage-inducible protein 1